MSEKNEKDGGKEVEIVPKLPSKKGITTGCYQVADLARSGTESFARTREILNQKPDSLPPTGSPQTAVGRRLSNAMLRLKIRTREILGSEQREEGNASGKRPKK